ncbi:CDGSH iron-sulfur domain-containing protein [Actinoplanes bogorensis]|uniref:CDGSH iron-sulfur domain-containing protein n=1 Tax=Paractinoplanes bogorensis TaxID=1610840 RepID=A0ABS5YPA6_9ACTN|nr:CDGSH iron-sulfur domain-containing protein [Actinoplanes bogorensis]MBU2665297.1 CDGSH iron-sulfur domain-containing protein [Actinoplanes bogorensis]
MTSTIVPYPDGPLIVRGDFEMRTPDGEPIDPGRGTIALCRCGRSAVKPFCDGTHKVVNFHAGAARETPAPRPSDVGGSEHPG